MEKCELIYTGKAKQIFATDLPHLIVVYFTDEASSENGKKTANLSTKGVINNQISSKIFDLLYHHGIQTHFKRVLNEREQLCHKLNIIPLEVIVRNIVAGTMAQRLGIKEGTNVVRPILEICYKNDTLGNPLINDYHALALGLVNQLELAEIYQQALAINRIIKPFFAAIGITLVDFKLEFGKNSTGKILLADEISPDTCRLWDTKSGDKLDKDRFRRDLGQVIESYKEVLQRINDYG